MVTTMPKALMRSSKRSSWNSQRSIPDHFHIAIPSTPKAIPSPLAHQEIDLHRLADVMQGLDGYFSGCDGYLDDLQRAGP
jgi:hypothetical protein